MFSLQQRFGKFRCNAILTACVWLTLSVAALGSEYIAASDTRIKFLGTWRPWNETFYSVYPGSSIRIKLQGSARLDLGHYSSDQPRIRVRRLGANGGTIYDVNDTVWLTASSAPVEYEVVFVAIDGGANNGTSLWMKGLWLSDGSTLLDATEPDGSLRVEFLGDSITHGVRILQSYGANLDSQDASQCFSYYAARALHAPYRIRGHSGVSTATLDSDVPTFTHGVPLWPPPDPDYFFINTGANDTEKSSSWFRENLGDVLRRVRTSFPSSYIYVLDFFRQNPDRESDIRSAISSQAAGHASYFNAFRYIRSMPDGIHPNAASHAALGKALAQLIGPAPALVAPLGGAIVSKRPELTWSSIPEAETYYLWVNRNGAKYTALGTGSATNWPSVADMPSGNYTWWVQAKNRYAGLGWSTAGQYVILPYAPDVAPLSGSPTGTIDPVRRPVFSWGAVDRATWYCLSIRRNGVAYESRWVEGGTTWQPDAELRGGNYQWWVRAWNADGYGPWSDVAAFTISVRTPAKIAITSPVGTNDDALAAYTWQADEAATWYRLWVNRNGSAWRNSWHYTGVTNGMLSTEVQGHTLGSYKWWVRGWGPDGYGPWSDPLEFTYGLSVLLTPTGVVENTQSPEFSWTKTGDVEWYLVWLSRDGRFYGQKWLQGTNWTFVADLPFGTYKWWVNTWKDQVKGPWSTPAEFRIGAVRPVYPSGMLAGHPTELRWNDAGSSSATWYQLWINWGQNSYWNKWVRREETESRAGQERAFTAPPEFIPPFGAYTWWIRAWTSTGTGPWSEGMDFFVP